MSLSAESTYIAGAIAHCTLGGMGVAGYLSKEQGLTFLTPLMGAMLAALLAALIISYMLNRSTMRLDTVLSAVWSIGMAVGIIFISKTGGYNEDLMSYLFGDILMVSGRDLVLITMLDLILMVIGLPPLQPLVAISFDEEFARISGIRVDLYNTVFLCMVALTVVLLVQVVGIILVVALLALPAAAAGQLTITAAGHDAACRPAEPGQHHRRTHHQLYPQPARRSDNHHDRRLSVPWLFFCRKIAAQTGNLHDTCSGFFLLTNHSRLNKEKGRTRSPSWRHAPPCLLPINTTCFLSCCTGKRILWKRQAGT